MTDPDTVLVEFVDAASGEVFARTQLPADQLPATFAPATTVDIAGEAWAVASAEPSTAAEFRATGRLVLVLHRIERVSPRDLLFSLPTICDELPAVDPQASREDCLLLREDDWRQIELVSTSVDHVVRAELAAIQRVFDDESVTGSTGDVVGFRNIHVRTQPTAPLARALPAAALPRVLRTVRHTYRAVAVGGAVAAGSFAFGLGPVTVYGVSVVGEVTAMGLVMDARDGEAAVDEAAAGLADLLRAYDLMIVDWCHRAVVGPESIARYLNATL